MTTTDHAQQYGEFLAAKIAQHLPEHGPAIVAQLWASRAAHGYSDTKAAGKLADVLIEARTGCTHAGLATTFRQRLS